MDDIIRLGLTYHVWPFSVMPDRLNSADRAYILSRTLAVIPPPPRGEDHDG